MYRIAGKIQGVAPILFNRFVDPRSLDPGGSTGGKPTLEDRQAEALTKVYRNDHGLFLPAWNFKKCLMEGCTRGQVKEGRTNLGTYIAATVFAQGELLFNREEHDFVHEVIGRRPAKKGGAVVIRRPALETGWELTFNLAVVDDVRSPDNIRRGMDAAGMLVGLGDWRPEYGRFIVTDWQVSRD